MKKFLPLFFSRTRPACLWASTVEQEFISSAHLELSSFSLEHSLFTELHILHKIISILVNVLRHFCLTGQLGKFLVLAIIRILHRPFQWEVISTFFQHWHHPYPVWLCGSSQIGNCIRIEFVLNITDVTALIVDRLCAVAGALWSSGRQIDWYTAICIVTIVSQRYVHYSRNVARSSFISRQLSFGCSGWTDIANWRRLRHHSSTPCPHIAAGWRPAGGSPTAAKQRRSFGEIELRYGENRLNIDSWWTDRPAINVSR